ncbi:MAG: DUF6796 family protein [Pseudomonadota bacterium]
MDETASSVDQAGALPARSAFARTALLACGAVGAALAVAADNIMLWQPASLAQVEQAGLGLVAAVPPDRVRLGSALGVPAFFLQAIGVLGVFACLRRTTDAIGALSVGVAGLLGFALFAGVAWHVSYPPLGVVANAPPGAMDEAARAGLTQDLSRFLADFYYISVYAFTAGAVGLAALCLMGWTRFARWFAVVSPLLIQPLLQAALPALPDWLAVGLYVSSLNAALLLFFVAAIVSPKRRSLSGGQDRSSLVHSDMR